MRPQADSDLPSPSRASSPHPGASHRRRCSHCRLLLAAARPPLGRAAAAGICPHRIWGRRARRSCRLLAPLLEPFGSAAHCLSAAASPHVGARLASHTPLLARSTEADLASYCCAAGAG